MNWLPPAISATRFIGSLLAVKNSLSAAVRSASFVMTPLIRQPSGSSVWAAATTRAPLSVGVPTAAYTVRLHRYKEVRSAMVGLRMDKI